jgi:hypothetical protein
MIWLLYALFIGLIAMVRLIAMVIHRLFTAMSIGLKAMVVGLIEMVGSTALMADDDIANHPPAFIAMALQDILCGQAKLRGLQTSTTIPFEPERQPHMLFRGLFR